MPESCGGANATSFPFPLLVLPVPFEGGSDQEGGAIDPLWTISVIGGKDVVSPVGI